MNATRICYAKTEFHLNPYGTTVYAMLERIKSLLSQAGRAATSSWRWVRSTVASLLVAVGISATPGPLYTPPIGDPVIVQAMNMPASYFRPAELDRIEERLDVIWVARAMYSEVGGVPGMKPYDALKQAWYIGWVIRNRVESGHRGKETYYDVIHDPAQFSAFLDAEKRRQLGTLDFGTSPIAYPLWHDMLFLADKVVNGERGRSPIGRDVLHFHHHYADPNWAKSRPDIEVDGKYRLYLYYGID